MKQKFKKNIKKFKIMYKNGKVIIILADIKIKKQNISSI